MLFTEVHHTNLQYQASQLLCLLYCLLSTAHAHIRSIRIMPSRSGLWLEHGGNGGCEFACNGGGIGHEFACNDCCKATSTKQHVSFHVSVVSVSICLLPCLCFSPAHTNTKQTHHHKTQVMQRKQQAGWCLCSMYSCPMAGGFHSTFCL